MSSPEPSQYDPFAAAYEEHAEVAPYNALYDRPAVLDVLGPVDGLTVLDAACGPGLYLEELVSRGARVIGCDAAPTMVELSAARVGGAADLRVHSLDEPFGYGAAADIAGPLGGLIQAALPMKDEIHQHGQIDPGDHAGVFEPAQTLHGGEEARAGGQIDEHQRRSLTYGGAHSGFEVVPVAILIGDRQ